MESEIEVLTKIDGLLGGLEKTAVTRVLAWVDNKYGDQKVMPSNLPCDHAEETLLNPVKTLKAPVPAKRKRKAVPGPKMVKDLDFTSSSGPSMRDFVAEKSPGSNLDKGLIAIFYFKKHLKISPISIDHVFTFFRQCGWRTPTNLPNTLQQAGSRGWLDTTHRDDVKITSMGEEVVIHDLPRNKK